MYEEIIRIEIENRNRKRSYLLTSYAYAYVLDLDSIEVDMPGGLFPHVRFWSLSNRLFFLPDGFPVLIARFWFTQVWGRMSQGMTLFRYPNTVTTVILRVHTCQVATTEIPVIYPR